MKNTFIASAISLVFALTCHAEKAPEAASSKLAVLLSATEANDIVKFESICDATMQEAITPELLQQVSTQVAPLLKQGYTKQFFGTIDRISVKTYYWKIDLQKEGSPDLLAELSIVDDKVAGFLIR